MGDDELKAGIEELIKAANLNLCLECGRCSAICPMLEFYGEFVFNRSPRAVVERLLFDPDDIYDESLWYCLNCQKCTAFCPNGIDFQGFMTGLRELLLRKKKKKHAHFC
ncbi:MAG: 4Fe-4S dicluster domain-containing protein, partial [Deltaproteobacteria bacterium]|nr:4Fe-4S dicluster domain-containing protein [Deltaproteobacteria bacterium]